MHHSMKTFVCNNCKTEVRRPTPPLKCASCGQQRVGLFKEVAAGAKAATAPPAPAKPAPVIKQTPPTIKPPSPPPPVQSALVKPPAPKPAPPPRQEPAQFPAPPSIPPAATTKAATPSAPRPRESAPSAPRPAPTAPTQQRPAPQQQATGGSRPPLAPSTGPGSIAWRFPVQIPGQDYSAVALRNCVAVEGERMYAAIGSKLYALQERDGALAVVWQYVVGGHIPGSPAIGGDGRVRIHSSDGKLHCVTAEGEAAHPPVAIEEPLGWASPVVDRQQNTWVCLYNGGLLRIDQRGIRSPTPFFRTRQKFDSTPLIRGELLYVGAEDGFVYAIDLSASRGRNQWDPLAGAGKTEWFINSSPALSPQPALIVAGRDEFLYAFDFSGAVLWKLHLRGQMLGSPVVTRDGDVLVGLSLIRRGQTGQGKLLCIDSRTPRVRWEYAADGAVESTPVIGDDGLIYFGDNAGTIHAVEPSGKKAWSSQTGSAIRSAGTILNPGRVIFGADNGTLVGLNCTSKSVAADGWPKYMGTLGQSGSVSG